MDKKSFAKGIVITILVIALMQVAATIRFDTVGDAINYIDARPTAPTISIKHNDNGQDIKIVDQYYSINAVTNKQSELITCYTLEIEKDDPSGILNGIDIPLDFAGIKNSTFCHGSPDGISNSELRQRINVDAVGRIGIIQDVIDSEFRSYSNFDTDIRVDPVSDIIGWVYNVVSRQWSNGN
ncbi:hypothetical protein LCGC14_0464490 [marine sediment metagenome]|uniref:Uncharacterized protein n=1 Tax=marine sediment metagenome TaxID=412755 RepID=A0A0F9SWU2_9ZZZZ